MWVDEVLIKRPLTFKREIFHHNTDWLLDILAEKKIIVVHTIHKHSTTFFE
jgi:hypothetical protein